jgi:hypothetical protein
MRPPCLNCKTRHLGCHDKCDRYKKYKEHFKTNNKEEKQFAAYLVSAMKSMKGERA